MKQPNHDEIDLFEFVKTLWGGKWKIIAVTTFVALLGGAYNLAKPNSFKVVSFMQTGNDTVFGDVISLQQSSLLDQNILRDEKQKNFSIDPYSTLVRVIEEFDDYEEMLDVLSKDNFVKQSIESLSDEEKQTALMGFAKSFAISAPTPNEKNARLVFEWHDVDHGKRILKEALSLVLSNVKASLLDDIDRWMLYIENKQLEKVKALEADLFINKERQKIIDEKRVLVLSEQAAIARELDIGINLDVHSSFAPTYLRGYKAIDEEISIIKSRSDKQISLMSEDYADVKAKIMSIENGLSSYKFRSLFEQINAGDPSDFVRVNLRHADVKPSNNALLSIFLSILIGGIFGVMYVLLMNNVPIRSKSLKK